MLALVLSLVFAGASAPGEAWLRWDGPPQCPDAARGAEELRRFLGERVPEVPVRVQLRAGAGGYEGTVAVGGASRTLQASDCETLGRAAALIVAVSVDPVAAAAVVLAEREAEAAELDETEPLAVPELDEPVQGGATPLATERGTPERPAERSRTGRTRRPVASSADALPRAEPAEIASSHAIGVSGGIGRAIVPALTAAIRLGHAFDRGAFRLRTDVTYAPPRVLTYAAAPDVGGRFQSVAVGVRACFAPGTARVTAPLCAGLEGAAVLGRGVGIGDARSPVGVWAGGLGSAGVVVRVHPRLALTADAELALGLRRPAFHVGSRETLFRATPAGVRALAGLELRVW